MQHLTKSCITSNTLRCCLSAQPFSLSAFVMSKTYIVAQKPHEKQLNVKVFHSKSATFFFSFFALYNYTPSRKKSKKLVTEQSSNNLITTSQDHETLVSKGHLCKRNCKGGSVTQSARQGTGSPIRHPRDGQQVDQQPRKGYFNPQNRTELQISGAPYIPKN